MGATRLTDLGAVPLAPNHATPIGFGRWGSFARFGTLPLDTFTDPWHCARHTKGDTMTALQRTLICSAAAIVATAWVGSGLDLGVGTLAATAGVLTAAYLTLWAWVEGEVRA